MGGMGWRCGTETGTVTATRNKTGRAEACEPGRNVGESGDENCNLMGICRAAAVGDAL